MLGTRRPSWSYCLWWTTDNTQTPQRSSSFQTTTADKPRPLPHHYFFGESSGAPCLHVAGGWVSGYQRYTSSIYFLFFHETFFLNPALTSLYHAWAYIACNTYHIIDSLAPLPYLYSGCMPELGFTSYWMTTDIKAILYISYQIN